MEPLPRRLEALLFISPRPLSPDELAAACEAAPDDVAAAVDLLREAYAPGRRGLELTEVAGGFTFSVADDCADAVRRHTGAQRPDELTPALLETLAVVAYLQPTTRTEIAEIRGVAAEWALSALVERGLVEELGRADTPGAPILYGTGDRFLRLFGMVSLGDLPPLEEFALRPDEVEELRTRLLRNAERRDA